MPEWEPVIGLEIHVQLKTRTKMFCRCEAASAASRTHARARCASRFPGALPVPNEPAVEWTIKLGQALECRIARARGLPPQELLLSGPAQGVPDLPVRRAALHRRLLRRAGARGDVEIGIVRAHLEEDAAKTIQSAARPGASSASAHSNVDFNRGGTPLVEIVTRPDIRSADEAKRFLQLLRQTIVELGISDAEMEKGHAARRRERLRRRSRRDGLPHAHRAEEHELVQPHRPRHRGRGAAPDRDMGVRRRGVQQTLDYEVKSDTVTPRRRRRRRTTIATSPSPISSRSSRRPSRRAARGRRCRSSRASASAASSASTSSSYYDAEVLNGSAGLAALYERVALEGVDAKAASNVLMNDSSPPASIPAPSTAPSWPS